MWSARVLVDPVQIFLAAGSHFQHYALREIIGMQLFHGVANALKKLSLGLDQEQPFLSRLNFALPAVHRFDPRHNVHAGSQSVLNQGVSDLSGFFRRPGSRKDNSRVGHGYLWPSLSIGEGDWGWWRALLYRQS